MKGIREQNMAKDMYKDEKSAEMLRKLEKLEIKDGKITVKIRAKPGGEADTPAPKKEAQVEIVPAPKKDASVPAPSKDEPATPSRQRLQPSAGAEILDCPVRTRLHILTHASTAWMIMRG